jgi:hypothetical protein
MNFKWKFTLFLQGTSETDVEECTYPLEDQPRQKSGKKEEKKKRRPLANARMTR